MAGTQGFASAGGFALNLWAIGTSWAILRRRALPRFVAVLAVAPATHLLLGLFGPLLDPLPGVLYLLYMLAIPGVIARSVALAVALLRWAPPEDASSPP